MRFTDDGVLNVLKEQGVRSADALNKLKKRLDIPKAGFTGVLDQFASGVLPVGVNRGTKIIKYLHLLPKEYEAEIFLGAATDTLDPTGTPVDTPDSTREWSGNRTDVEKALADLTGTYAQVPPEYSSKKIKGIRASDLVRQGQNVSLEPVTVTVHSIRLLEYKEINQEDPLCPAWYHGHRAGLLKIKTLCSTGTYIRSLARDIAGRMGTISFVMTLIRTAVGGFKLENSVKIEDPGIKNGFYSLSQSLDFLPEAEIKADAVDKLSRGVKLVPGDFNCDNLEKGIFRVIFDGNLVAVLENKNGQLGYVDNLYSGS